MIKRNYDSPDRRLRQLERVLLIVELLAPLRCGATTSELATDVSDLLGRDYCERTIRRDLKALELLGLVETLMTRERSRQGAWNKVRWRWIDCSFRSTVFNRMAVVRAEERDPMPVEAG